MRSLLKRSSYFLLGTLIFSAYGHASKSRSDMRPRPYYVSPEYHPNSLASEQEKQKTQERVDALNSLDDSVILGIRERILADANAPVPELEPIVAHLIDKIKSKPVWGFVSKNPFAKAQAELLLQSLSLLNISFYMTPDVSRTYPYDPPYDGPFPWLAMKIAIDRSLEFFEALRAAAAKDQQSQFALYFDVLNRLPPTFAVVAENSQADAESMNFFENKDEEESAIKQSEQAESTLLARIRKNPMGETRHLMLRIENDINAPLGEYFGHTARTIMYQMRSLRVRRHVENDTVALRQAKTVVRKLKELMAAALPYRETLIAIDQAMMFFDAITRAEPDQKRQDYYHSDRYSYKRAALFNDPSFVIFPTSVPLGFSDFIYTRAAPIGFVGVSFKTLFNDRHYNSPYDFWIHDLNHIFRMSNFNKRAFDSYDRPKRRDRTRPENPAEFQARNEVLAMEWAEYTKWQEWIEQKVWPLVNVPPLAQVDKTSDRDWKKNRNMAKLMRLIIFEVFHESAAPPTEAFLRKDLGRGAGQLSTFERVHDVDSNLLREEDANKDDKQRQVDLEKIRTFDGNLQSGCRILDYTPKHRFVEYIQDRAVVTLGNVYNKMCYGFYDEAEVPQPYVVDNDFRSAEYLAEAASLLFQKLGVEGLRDLGRDEILQQVRSQQGSEELFRVFPTARGVNGCLEK